MRAGHFPNITHAQGVLGHATGRFQQALGGRATIEWKVFNAGPSAIEAIFAGDLDLTYIGPNPAAKAIYIQLGHDGETFHHPGYRRLVHNAILWSAGRLN